MSCLSPTENELEAIRKKMGSQEINDNLITLMRGGFVVKTPVGNVQVGMPPETVKDSMNLGISMPNVFIVPRVRYDKESFLNVSEFEFPAYFNFFITRKRVRILCTAECKNLLEIVFQETLLGPKDFTHFEKEFDDSVTKAFMPDMKKELGYFAINPFTKEKLTVDTQLDIVTFDENGEYVIDEKVRVVNNEERDIFEFYDIEKNKFIAKTPQIISQNKDTYYCSKLFKEEKIKLILAGSGRDLINEKEPLGFTPPYFGVTVLGASHGFDCHGSTSGYIIWVNQRGIMVDPPPFSGTSLREFGIPPNIIDKVIITHCHADHDAGSFQKILMAHQVEIVTSPTIMGSFLRKYSALTGFTIKQQKSFFVFRPVTLGAPLVIAGAEFRFFYSFHSIPTIGFEINYCGKSLYFSGDTYYNPPALKDIYLKGVFSKQRYEALSEINWLSYDLILHEAGVPPIHTPTKVLADFSPAIKERLYLVHIADKDIPKDVGLKAAIPGLENTIILPVMPTIDKTIQKLDLQSSIDIFNNIPLNKAKDQIRCCQEEEYNANQVVIREGTFGNKFYIIMSGIAKIYSDVEGKSFGKFAYAGDYFGETAILNNGKRNANVTAYTALKLIVQSKHDFNWVFGITSHDLIQEDNSENTLIGRLKNQTKMRTSVRAEFINANNAISIQTELQKNELVMCMKERPVKKDEWIWKKGELATGCFFVFSGNFHQVDRPEKIMNLPEFMYKSNLVGDFPSLTQDTNCTTSCRCTEDGELYFISKEQITEFFSRNPGIFVQFKDQFIIA